MLGMTMTMDKVCAALLIISACLTVFAHDQSRHHRAQGDVEECLLRDQTKGLCRANCPSRSSGEAEPVICRYEGDVAYVCCNVSQSVSRGTIKYHHESLESDDDVTRVDGSTTTQHDYDNYAELSNDGSDAGDSDRDDDDDVEDKFFLGYNNRRRNRWNRRRTSTEPYYHKYQSAYNGKYIRDDGTGLDSNRPHPTSKRPSRSQYNDGNNFYIWSDKETSYNNGNNYNNYNSNSNKPNRLSGSNEWTPPGHANGRPHAGNGNAHVWQENHKNPNYYDRRTTERPRTTTTYRNPDFRPGGRPDYNRPDFERPDSNRPEGNRPDYNRPDYNRPDYNRPDYNRPNTNRPDYNRPDYNRPDYNRPNTNRPDYNRPDYNRPNTNRPEYNRPDKNRPDYNRPVANLPVVWPNQPDNNRPQVSQQSGGRKRISELKCEEYSRPVKETITGLPLTPDPKPIKINVDKCISAQHLIVGGQNTTLGEFPHMAAIGFATPNGIEWKCGGSLISDQYVLTAAHCTKTRFGQPVRVRLGEYNLKEDNDGAAPEDYSITKIIIHPEHKVPSKYNDIALVKLSRRVEIRKHIRPACLQVVDDPYREKVIAIGWGQTDRADSQSDVLLKVALSIVGKNACNRAYENLNKRDSLPNGIIDSQMCAGELEGGKDTCSGDSGGPIEVTSKENQCIHYIVGITSFGRLCGLANSPGVYTRVSSYVPWIESVVWPQ